MQHNTPSGFSEPNEDRDLPSELVRRINGLPRQKMSEPSPASVPHETIIERLLETIEPIDFRAEAELEDNENLSRKHYHVITIEKVQALAREKSWGLCKNQDFIYLYNGAFWKAFEKDDLKSFLGEAAERLGADRFNAKHYQFREALVKQFLSYAHLPTPQRPKDIVQINLQNGTYEISPKGRHLRPFQASDFLTYQLPFTYDREANAPLFKAYLDKVQPDPERQRILAEYLGYVFIQSTTLKLEKALLLYGSGANGKSVLFEIVNALFGEQNVSHYTLQSLTNETGYQRAKIANKLINYASELNGNFDTSLFKQLVSGEPVEARLPYGQPFSLSQYAKLIFNCNELPKDVEHSHAYFRRFLIVPFDVTVPEDEQDKELAAKIIASELSGVFNWVLEGLERLLPQKKFTHSEAVNRQVELYKKQSDSVQLFLEEHELRPSVSGCKPLKELYNQYKSFCAEYGYRPVHNSNFKKRLEAAGVQTERRKAGWVCFVEKTERQ